MSKEYMSEAKGEWVPYYGNQFRVKRLVLEMLDTLELPPGSTFAETNAGSFAVAYEVAKTRDMRVIGNDISMYSTSVGRALFRMPFDLLPISNGLFKLNKEEFRLSLLINEIARNSVSPITTAALGAAIIQIYGYDLKDRQDFSAIDFMNVVSEWATWFLDHSFEPAFKPKITRLDLYEFIKRHEGDIIYMDFAWPWKGGEGTEEYSKMVDLLSSTLAQEKHTLPELWTKQNVVKNVVAAVDLSEKNFDYIIVSNQSSNYPSHEILLKALSHFDILAIRQLTLPARDVDNRLNEPWFTEYQYIIASRR